MLRVVRGSGLRFRDSRVRALRFESCSSKVPGIGFGVLGQP